MFYHIPRGFPATQNCRSQICTHQFVHFHRINVQQAATQTWTDCIVYKYIHASQLLNRLVDKCFCRTFFLQNGFVEETPSATCPHFFSHFLCRLSGMCVAERDIISCLCKLYCNSSPDSAVPSSNNHFFAFHTLATSINFFQSFSRRFFKMSR